VEITIFGGKIFLTYQQGGPARFTTSAGAPATPPWVGLGLGVPAKENVLTGPKTSFGWASGRLFDQRSLVDFTIQDF
jgi:hypothetical protein